jgi:hypothetical protein
MVARPSRWSLPRINLDSTRHKVSMDSTVAGMPGECGERFLLWVDAVGGYLVCCGGRVALGQAVPGNPIDIPIQGDLARRHATLSRQPEGYVLTAEADMRVSGEPVRGAVLLRDRALLELGRAVKLQFRLPNALSSTAQLLPVSHHRTCPAADGVLLLADNCILGPGAASHIVARHFLEDVALLRRQDELRCRAAGTLEIDGSAWRGEGPLTTHSRVCGERFSFSLEKI